MFKLTSKLAVSNLIKNRTLYYPFALATMLAVAISYIFMSLTFNPHLKELRGASTVSFTLVLGVFIVTIASAIIVFYANSFVMKNRSKEMGIYGMLGLDKRHLLSMVVKELLLFGLLTVSLGVLVGFLFDKLLYAVLLKAIHMPVVLVSSFQPMVLIAVLVLYGLIFLGLILVNGWRILRMNALQLSKEKASGEKKGRFLGLQTVLGLLSLGGGYGIALSVKDPLSAIFIFFGAVLLVILGTYLLFNAGITVFLQLLKKNKRYYYQSKNMISVSNLIFRMKKNAVGLATISILSTMVLVTLTVGVSLYAGGEHFIKAIAPSQFAVSGRALEKSDVEELISRFESQTQVKIEDRYIYQYKVAAIEKVEGNHLIYSQEQKMTQSPYGAALLLSREDYEHMTGKSLSLADDEALLYSSHDQIDSQQTLKVGDKDFKLKEVTHEDFVTGHLPNQYQMLVANLFYLVVNDPQQLSLPQIQMNSTETYGSLNTSASDEEQEKYLPIFQKIAADMTATFPDNNQYILVDGQTEIKSEVYGLIGGTFFIGVFLSVVFLLGAVLVIYYKQVSEGYEDRERFIILQKVGLDEHETKATIRKQVLTVFFLPLIFAFLHLAFAYHMISLILQIILGGVNGGLMLTVTLATCGIFLLVYVAVFLLTSRSYHRIVKM